MYSYQNVDLVERLTMGWFSQIRLKFKIECLVNVKKYQNLLQLVKQLFVLVEHKAIENVTIQRIDWLAEFDESIANYQNKRD